MSVDVEILIVSDQAYEEFVAYLSDVFNVETFTFSDSPRADSVKIPFPDYDDELIICNLFNRKMELQFYNASFDYRIKVSTTVEKSSENHAKAARYIMSQIKQNPHIRRIIIDQYYGILIDEYLVNDEE